MNGTNGFRYSRTPTWNPFYPKKVAENNHYGLKPVPYAIRTNDPQSLTGQAGTEQAAPHSLLLASLSLNFLALSLSIPSILPSFQLSQCSHHSLRNIFTFLNTYMFRNWHDKIYVSKILKHIFLISFSSRTGKKETISSLL